MRTFHAGCTDTIGGDPNYSWLDRAEAQANNWQTAWKQIRKALNLKGRWYTDWYDGGLPGRCLKPRNGEPICVFLDG